MKNNKALIYVLTTLIIILLAVVGYFAYLTFNEARSNGNQADQQSEQETDTADSDTDLEPEEVEEEESSDATLPEGWEEHESTIYGYSIATPEGWYYRFFSETRLIGTDPNPIPEASEYAGVIVFIQDEREFETMRTQIFDSLKGAIETEVEVSGRTWTQIEGVLPDDDIFNPSQHQTHSLISENGMSYRLTLIGVTYTDIYEQVLASISFSN